MSAAPHSGGEWAGIASAVVLVLGSIGGGIAWIARWGGERRKTRAQGLQEWEGKLQAREAELDAAIDARLSKLEGRTDQLSEENMALRMAFELVAEALRAKDPRNNALIRAEQLLANAFPLVPAILPADMNGQLGAIDRADRAATAAARGKGGRT